MTKKPTTIDVTPTRAADADMPEAPSTALARRPQAEDGVDLNRLQEAIRENRAALDARPVVRARQVFVDTEGRIWLGDEVTGSDTPLSEVHQATFAVLTQRQQKERAVVRARFPRGTTFLKVGRTGGWLYRLTTELGDAFQLFAYWDGDSYQVKVVKPTVEGRSHPHLCHLFPDGTICFGKEHRAGMPTLEGSYAKSVLWANGYSVFHRTGTFPF